MVYNIIVYTGSVLKPGSRAQVYLTLYGALRMSSEIHLTSPTLATGFQSSASKVFLVIMQDVGPISAIRIRPDGAAKTPNWNIHKVLIIPQLETVYEFTVSEWLQAGGIVKPRTALYPATSMKFISYPPCIHPLESRMHPDTLSSLVLLKDCSKLQTIFHFHQDGVIQHLVSGMCFQGSKTGDPSSTAHGDQLKLNFPCTLYRPGYNTHYALQFMFTSGGSLMERKSGKCISTNKGQLNVPLTFSDVCDTDDTKIQFIDKNNNVLLPEKVGKSPLTPPPPSPPTGSSPPNIPSLPTLPPITPGTLAPAPPGTPRTENVPSVTDTGSFGGNHWPIFCPADCSSSSCASSCQPVCCGGLQQPANIPSTYPVTHCPTYCSPGQCRAECPVGCCFPNLVTWRNQTYDENNEKDDDDNR